MNQQICSLKRAIEAKIEGILKIAKHCPKVKNLISRLLQEQSCTNLTQNLKNGKVAAMKAQRRLIETSQRQLQRTGR